jgi:hypothetical protein
MTDWRESRIFCNGCRRWRTKLWHEDCRLGSGGSLLYVDFDNLEGGCNKCNETWPVETFWLLCTCGHFQYTRYVDTIDVLQVGEQVVATDGNLAYVLTRSGTLVVGRRSFPELGA